MILTILQILIDTIGERGLCSVIWTREKERMASVKARLTVALRANHVVVAELDDPSLWQRVLAALNLGDPAPQKLEPSGPVVMAGRK